MARRRHLRSYTVHLFKEVTVVVRAVAAEDEEAAVDRAEASLDWEALFRDIRGYDTAYNEGSSGYVVDRDGDDDFRQSVYFESVTNPLAKYLRDIVNNERSPELLRQAIRAADQALRSCV